MRKSSLTLAHAESAITTARHSAGTAHVDQGRLMPKVLVIAYRFPPQGGGGVQRTLKFVKYLPQWGWLPVVHTVRNPYWPLRDDTLLGEIPLGVQIYRTLTAEFERLQGAAGSLFSEGEGKRDDGHGGAAAPPRTPSLLRRSCKAVANIIQRHILIPDPQVAWIPPAFLKSLYIIRKAGAALIYTSSPPNSTQVLGLILKRVTKLPWVADFRDPWTEGIRRRQAYQGNRGRQRLEEALERAVLTRADHVVVTTEKTMEQFLAKYPSVLAEKFSVITNGFDPDDAAPPSAPRLLDPRQFNVTLTGNVEALFDARPFFHTLRELLDEDAEIRSRLRVNFVGTKRGKYDDYLRQHDLDGHVRYIGYVPHATCLQYLAESDALFLCQIPVHESASTKLSGKLFEYLYMRKPILALTLPGLTADILSRSGLGTVVDPNDQVGIKQALRDLYLRHKVGQSPVVPDDAYIDSFNRIHQTQRLSRIFEQLVGQG
jgi:glycosyltransferase involved in cell wall biosynthesis